MIKPGIWRHYADKLYLVVGMATHSETNEELVLYIPLYTPLVVPGKHQIVVRPAKMWEELVHVCVCWHSFENHTPNLSERGRADAYVRKDLQLVCDRCACAKWDEAKTVQRFAFERDA